MNPISDYWRKRKLKAIRKNFIASYFLAFKNKQKLSQENRKVLKEVLNRLQNCLIDQNLDKAEKASEELKDKTNILLAKSSIRKTIDFFIAVAVALSFAFVIRQMWFELYEIPTGSMRPTLKEKDRLAVSKLDYGLNIPFSPSHFYFNPKLVNRSDIFVFTTENMNVEDSDTVYFYLFPGKKLFVKRLMAKPEDTIYFYGGRVYGIDKEGNSLYDQLNLSALDKIDHIPFIRLDGKSSYLSTKEGLYSNSVIYSQMGHPILQMGAEGAGKMTHSFVIPENMKQNSSFAFQNYGDIWGMKNFAMARLLTRSELRTHDNIKEAPLYLELRHDPNIKRSTLNFSNNGKLLPSLNIETSIIPLSFDHLKTLFSNLYTARFDVKDGIIRRYGSQASYHAKNSMLPKISGVEDGRYEFYYGKAYKILWQGIAKELPKEHPLYYFSLDRLALFFNLGIEFNTLFSPSMNSGYFPSRYAYFREGDLYIMGAKLLNKEDPTLVEFINSEKQKAEFSTTKTYFPFIDHGAPLKEDGTLDVEFIKNFGLHIPQGMYLGLGDNHAMSSDSRDFGFIPEANIKGSPDFIFWPFGPRFGFPVQPSHPFFVVQRVGVWTFAIAIFSFWIIQKRKKEKLPLNLDKLDD